MYGGYANGAANGYATGAANSYGQQQAAYAGQAPQSYQQPAQPTPPPPAMPGLPAGWSPARCPTTGNTYFYEHATGKVSWTPPKAPEAVVAASARPLPPSTQVPQNYEGASAQTLPEEAQDAWDAVQAHIAASRMGRPPPQFSVPSSSAPKKRGGDLSSLKKDLESPPDVLQWRRERDITVAGGCDSCFPRFEDAPLLPALYTSLKAAGFATPSPIQGQAWPPALQGRDVIGVAKTGSGKTLGFLVPAFKLLCGEGYPRPCQACAPKVLVLAPTRELATQIEDEARKFGGPLGVKSVCCYGGAPKGPQMAALRQGAHVCIATPGRLNDFLEAGMVDLYACRYLVFDEADRMLDMGFEPQIRRIVQRCPDQRQTLFFTATWPREVRSLASEFLAEPVVICVEINQCSAMRNRHRPAIEQASHRWRGGRRADSARTRRKILIFTQVVIYVGDTSGSLKANADVTQHVFVTHAGEKDRLLAECVRKEVQASQGTCRIIVFANSKRLCDQLERSMPRLLQLRCAAMHGDKDQYQRTQTIEAFKVGICPVLIATDVAARGLDIKDVRAVINYDFPGNVEDYVHRIGRTGRAGATGNAYTFFTARDERKAGPLVKLMEDAGQQVPDELRAMCRGGSNYGSSMQFSSGRGGGGGNGHYGGGGGGGGGGGRGRGVDNRPAWMAEQAPPGMGVAPPQMPSGPPPPGAYTDRSRSRSRGRRRDRSRSRGRRDRGRRRRSDSR